MSVEDQRKEQSMGGLDKVPSNLSIHGEKDEEDEYYSYSDSEKELRSENSWSDLSPQFHDIPPPKFSLAVAFLKRLHGIVAQKKGDATLEDIEWQDSFLCNNDASFPNDPTGELPNSWGAAEAISFQIRGETYLKDRKKVTGKGTLMELGAANMLKSTTKQDDIAGRSGSICQKFAATDRPDFFFIVNMQIPGPTTVFHIAFYYSTTSPIKDVPLLQNFVEGDDAYRNARFKLIPNVSKGPWLVKQSVGNRPCLLGQVLKIQYARGKNYLEINLKQCEFNINYNTNPRTLGFQWSTLLTNHCIFLQKRIIVSVSNKLHILSKTVNFSNNCLDVDVGASVIAKKVANRVLSSFNHLIVEAAFLIQGNTPEELPEHLLGTCRMSHIDISKVPCT